ncbi:anti-repressor SinI family protein [Bacillus sp. S13(2024)]|uniref:anti-repressor SinI family protein n=1 Tax=unclassified Bacillus (in: firmicutes) TaxID=185979 RepID=UPI003D252BD2
MENQVEKKVKDQEQETDFIDLEWQELILDAKRMGLTVNEVRNFFFSEQNKICGN